MWCNEAGHGSKKLVLVNKGRCNVALENSETGLQLRMTAVDDPDEDVSSVIALFVFLFAIRLSL